MDDPWANAWGDSSTPSIPEPSPLWAAPSVSVLQADNPDDLSIPSWQKGSVSGWSADDLSADHIWTRGDTPQGSSPTETQEAGSYPSSVPLHEERAWVVPSIQLQISTHTSVPEPIPSEINVSARDEEGGRSLESQPSPISLPKSISASLSEDVDGFGSFETGTDNLDKESWTPTNSGSPLISSTVSANWDSAWQAKSEHGNNEQEDAWEAARRQKEKQDRHVPPELLSSILRQFEGISNDMWEDVGPSNSEVDDNLDFEMLCLNPVLIRLSPDDMTLPPTVSFAKTFTMKHMSESLKLTRHCTSTRSSPMAMYLASKGSSSWEAAVKAKPIVVSDDVTPVGWKIVDSSTQGESPVDDGRKKAGGLFSFFGRRTHNLSMDGNSKQPASPMTASGASPSNTLTPRAGSPASVEPINIPERSQPAVTEPSNICLEIDTKSSSSTIPTIGGAKDGIQPEATQPSAVSRFLGRIVGRPKTRSMDSLALSADDLKFLADVPTSSDSNGPTEDLMSILETPLPLPSTSPLAPPSRRESPLPKLPPPPSRPTQPGGSDDLLSLFDPRPIQSYPENSSTVDLQLPDATASSKPASGQSTVSSAPPKWTTFEAPAIKSTSIDTIGLLKSSSSRPTTNGIKSVFEVGKSSGSSSNPALAPPISVSTAFSLNSVQVDDDEFSDFLSSPAAQSSQHSSSPLNNPTVPSIKMTSTHDDDFGEFGDAINEFSAPQLHAPAVVLIPSTQSGNIHARKKTSRKADHSRTLSLLENAAARGRWLSPPSPIPEALSPPPDRSASNSVTVNSDDHKLDMQTQQSIAMTAYSADKSTDSAKAWRLPPPPSGTLLKPSVFSSALVDSRPMPPSRPEFVVQSSRSPSNAQSGGLSAQDLSFFEGL